MSHDREPLTEVDCVRLVVADDPECGQSFHAWPVEFAYGDTCACGRYYLLRNAEGEVRIEETPEP